VTGRVCHRLQRDFWPKLRETLRLQPPDTWDMLTLSGGGTPAALRPPAGLPISLVPTLDNLQQCARAYGREYENRVVDRLWCPLHLVYMGMFPGTQVLTLEGFNSIYSKAVNEGLLPGPSSAAYLIRNDRLQKVASSLSSTKSTQDLIFTPTFDWAMVLKHIYSELTVEASTRCLAYPKPHASAFATGSANATVSKLMTPELTPFFHISTFYPHASTLYPPANCQLAEITRE